MIRVDPKANSQLHLYAAWGCPFCHRVLVAMVLAGLGDHVTISWMRNIKGPAGWEIAPGDDPLFGESSLKKVYERLEPGVEHTPSVPLLVELSSKTLLSSSSMQITRYFARGMNGAHPVCLDLSPANLIEQIDTMNEWLHSAVNRAVYEVGFSAEQGGTKRKSNSSLIRSTSLSAAWPSSRSCSATC